MSKKLYLWSYVLALPMALLVFATLIAWGDRAAIALIAGWLTAITASAMRQLP